MERNTRESLSSVIVTYVGVTGLVMMLLLFFWFDAMGKKTLMGIEREKAELIARVYAEKAGLNLYLGFEEKLQETLRQLLAQQDIEAVALELQEGKGFRLGRLGSQMTFRIEMPVYDPRKRQKLADLTIYYSSRHYQTLLDELQKMLLLYLVVSGILYLLLLYLIRKKLEPLDDLAQTLAAYEVDKPVKIQADSSYIELFQIERAIQVMQERVKSYAKLQQNMNEILAKKVKEKTDALKHQLYTDSLTRLPNRRALYQDLRKVRKGLMILLNVDDFSEINDLYGPSKGDKILRDLGKFLVKLNLGRVYRTSGDEFVILHHQPITFAEAEKRVETLRKKVEEERFDIGEGQIDLQVTMGVTFYTPLQLVHADMAYQTAKREHKPYAFYSEKWQMEEVFRLNLHWIREVKNALIDERIKLFAQPIYDLKNDRIKGYEMLVRLIDKEKNVVTPDRFLNLARRSHFYSQITRSVVEQACRFFSQNDLSFSVNVLVDDVRNEETVAFIKQCLAFYGVSDRAIFEIVESENIEFFPEVNHFIHDMKEMGSKIAIDDFGSGYSNFNYLAHLHVDMIKIDGSLVRHMVDDPDTSAIIETIVSFARKLQIETVAEYVVDKETMRLVKQMGVDYIQGDFVGKPIPLEKVSDIGRK